MTGVVIFAALSVLLVAGKILRVQIPLLQRLYLPSSIVGGILGLIIIHLMSLEEQTRLCIG